MNDSQFLDPNQVYAQNNALIGNAQQQAQNFSNQYSGYNQQANQAQSGLKDYQATLARPENQLGNVYQTNLTGAENQFGFDPASLQKAQQALAQTNTVMANLPAAVQQSANGRGITGAQEATRYQQQAGNVQAVAAGQGNNVQALQSTLGAAQNQAGQQTGFTGQSQQIQLQALNEVFTNAQAQQAAAGQQLDYFKSLQAQGIQLNEQEQGQVAALRQAQAQAAMAAAQAQSAAAAMLSAQNQGKLINAQLAALQQGNNSTQALQNGMPNLTGYRSPNTGLLSQIEQVLTNFGKNSAGVNVNLAPLLNQIKGLF